MGGISTKFKGSSQKEKVEDTQNKGGMFGISKSKSAAMEETCTIIILALRNLQSIDIFLPKELVFLIAEKCYSTYSGNVVTVAGTGNSGILDGTTSTALCNYPMGVCIDRQKNIYFTDYHNHNLRKIDVREGTVRTIAGSEVTPLAGPKNGRDGQFNSPIGICSGPNDEIYVADYFNHSVRKIVPPKNRQNEKKWKVSTLSGTGRTGSTINGEETCYNGPYGVVCDKNGNVILADCQNHRILRISSDGKNVECIAGFNCSPGNTDGPVETAQLHTPVCVCFDLSGNLLFTDFSNHSIRKLDFTTKTITTIAGTGEQGFRDGKASEAQFSNPVGICVSGKDILVADYANFRVRRITPDGIVTTAAGSTKGYSDGMDALFDAPIGICNYAAGIVIVTDGGHRIRKVYI